MPAENDPKTENNKEKTIEKSDESENKSITGDTFSFETIADELVSSMPSVQEHAIDEEKRKQKEEIEQYSHLVDNQGVPFNPEIHKINRNGEPTVSKTGKLMRKPSSKIKMTDGVKNEIKTGEEKQKAKVVAQTLGKTTAGVIFASFTGIFGDEWEPKKDASTGLDERTYMEVVWSQYYEATGKTDLPPSMILVAGMTAYIAPRLSMPKTRKKTATILEKLGLWWKARKLKTEAKNLEKRSEKENKKDEKKSEDK